MDQNKRGNPPFEPSSYAAGLERRVERYRVWGEDARYHVRNILLASNPAKVREAEDWWRGQFDQPEVVLALDPGIPVHPTSLAATGIKGVAYIPEEGE